jgi:hypothetical protein
MLKLPITNVYAKGDYCLTLHIGSNKSAVNLLIDTGSSSLVIKNDNYQADFDKNLISTSIVQEVNYGIGGWNGPVVYTSVTVQEYGLDTKNLEKLTAQSAISTPRVPIAIVYSNKQSKTFGDADGILGMAYHHLNKGFDFQHYFVENNIKPAQSYPWPFNEKLTEDLAQFKTLLWQQPEQDITPYFSLLAEKHLTADKFALYTKRSSIHINSKHTDKTPAAILRQDPLNQGFLILGGGEEQTDLYRGKFTTITVEHDVYYNVNLDSIQIGSANPIMAEPLAANHQKAYCSNAIIDSGAGVIVLTASLYEQVIKALIAYNPEFEKLLTPFKSMTEQSIGIASSALKLAQWPNLYFNFVNNSSQNEEKQELVQLTCSPSTYWQINAPTYGRACFKLLSQLPQWPNQSILGLPLLNNYFVVFDRGKGKKGEIKFANSQ